MFSETDIKEGILDFNDSALMRIVVKWIKDLEKNFENIFNRKEPFRKLDGQNIFLRIDELKRLESCLEE